MGVVFDKLGFVKRLESGGDFTRPQAKILSEALHDAVAESVATKHDVSDLRNDLRQELSLLRSDMKAGFAELRSGIAETRVWAVSVGASVVTVLAAIEYFG